MFDLESSLSEWRRQMRSAGLNAGRGLDELESHLREEISALKSAGTAEAEAFEQAVAHLGSPQSVCTEFNKLRVGHIWAVKIGSGVWLAAILAVAGWLVRRLMVGRLDLVLGAHVLSITAGYGGAMLLGAFGMLYVVWGRSGRLSPARRQSLIRAVHRFLPVAAGLVITGLFLGMLWSRQNWGRYWDWDPKEIGGLGASAWLAIWVVLQRYGRLRDRAVMLLGIGGSTVVTLAWLGGNLWDNHRRLRANGSEVGWVFAVLLGIQLVFLVMGMTPAREGRES